MEASQELFGEFDNETLPELTVVPGGQTSEQPDIPPTLDQLMARRQEIIDAMTELTVQQFSQYSFSKLASAELTVKVSLLSGELSLVNAGILAVNRGRDASQW